MPDIEKIHSNEENYCQKVTKYNGNEHIENLVNFKTDTDNLKFVVHRYRNKLYVKNIEVDIRLTKYHALLTKRICLLSYIDIFHKLCSVLDETTIPRKNKLCQD